MPLNFLSPTSFEDSVVCHLEKKNKKIEGCTNWYYTQSEAGTLVAP